MFPTKAEIEARKIEQLKPQAEQLVRDCIDALMTNGAPARVDCTKYPQKVRQMVINAALDSEWDVKVDCGFKGEEFLLITETPQMPAPAPKKFWELTW